MKIQKSWNFPKQITSMNLWFKPHRVHGHTAVPKQAYQQLRLKCVLLCTHVNLDETHIRSNKLSAGSRLYWSKKRTSCTLNFSTTMLVFVNRRTGRNVMEQYINGGAYLGRTEFCSYESDEVLRCSYIALA
jgi:hypothetical protein